MAARIAIDPVLFADMESFLTQDFSNLDTLLKNREQADMAFEQVWAQSKVLDTMKTILHKMVNIVNDYYLLNQNAVQNYLKIGRELMEGDEAIQLSLAAVQSEGIAHKWEVYNQPSDIKDHMRNLYMAAGYDVTGWDTE